VTLAPKRLYLSVGACATVVYLGVLWNRFALDDRAIIVLNPLVHSASGLWRAFTHSYWPLRYGGEFYRPLPIATYTLDGLVGGGATWWFHLPNLVWHAGTSIAVAVLARRWRGDTAGLIAGLLFAVHPVHVEAVASVIGRAEMMAALFSLVAVYAAVAWRSVGWSTLALVLGILSKENAIVVPALVAWTWIVGLDRPSPTRMAAFAGAWALGAAACFAARWVVLGGVMGGRGDVPQFLGADPVSIRLTAVAALADVARLLVFPLHLRVDYSLAERTLVTSGLDSRFLAGLACVGVLATLLVLAWRSGRKVEACGLGWIAIAYLPVANLLVPIGVLVAERALYLPSVGLALAGGVWLTGLPARGRRLAVAALVLAGAARTALRVPVWRDDTSATLSILKDSPDSYVGPLFTAALLQGTRAPARALEYYRVTLAIYDRDLRGLFGAADAAFALGRPALADSFLTRTQGLCGQCQVHYFNQATAARDRGDSAVAEALFVRAKRLAPQP